mmetsp:Transcript_31533/g.41759  ORF Transcript_31533/g.41759 Transcript_31533/m.41759 type:complete len:125 (+) Transcript_31533:676-1050(+)
MPRQLFIEDYESAEFILAVAVANRSSLDVRKLVLGFKEPLLSLSLALLLSCFPKLASLKIAEPINLCDFDSFIKGCEENENLHKVGKLTLLVHGLVDLFSLRSMFGRVLAELAHKVDIQIFLKG